MKQHTPFLALVVAAAALGFAAAQRSEGQSDAGAELAALLTQVEAQQKILAENQSKIEEHVGKAAEEVRLARIYASRGGKK